MILVVGKGACPHFPNIFLMMNLMNLKSFLHGKCKTFLLISFQKVAIPLNIGRYYKICDKIQLSLYLDLV